MDRYIIGHFFRFVKRISETRCKNSEKMVEYFQRKRDFEDFFATIGAEEVKRMEDHEIIGLYFARDTKAIEMTKEKYGRYCKSIAKRILDDPRDAEECENDTYLDAWNAIPPEKPNVFSVFLGTITRRIALDRFRQRKAAKRGGGDFTLSLDELSDCIPSGKSIDEAMETKALAEIINRFLRGLPDEERAVFLRRYWFFESTADITERFGFSAGKIKMMLSRTRKKLRTELEKEGIFI